MKRISSRDNPGFKALKALVAGTREQRRQGLVLLDGIHPVSAYLDKVGLPRQLIVSEHGLTQAEIHALVERAAGVDILLLGDALFRSLSDMATPVGILGLIDIPVPPSAGIRGSCVMLDAVQDAGNVGSILRSAAAAGVGDVVLGKGCAGAWSSRVLRAAQGAHFDLHIHEQVDLASFMQAYAGTTVAAVAHGGESLYRLDLSGDVAWLFGNEGNGIAPELEAAVRKRACIPMASGSESLNVAAAAAVCLFEQVRQRIVSSAGGLRCNR